MDLDYKWRCGDRAWVDNRLVAVISQLIDADGVRVERPEDGKSPVFAKLWPEDKSGCSMYRPISDLELVPASERETMPRLEVADGVES